ncbi:MAG TPA: Maf family protein, partial [Anaerolineales bacterium]|nr:Maf family protein [Anaerolineales bacterium]
DLACTQVTMRAYSDSEMAVYIHSGDPLDKAGGYAIQHVEFRPVARIEGCYTNVVGLPLCRATDALARAGLVSAAPASYACLYVPGAPCSVAYDLLENTPDMG